MYLLFSGSVGKAQDYPGHCTCSSRGLGGNGGLATLPGQCDQYSQVPVLCSTVLYCALLCYTVLYSGDNGAPWVSVCTPHCTDWLEKSAGRITRLASSQETWCSVAVCCESTSNILHPPPFPCAGHRTGARLRGTLYTSSSSTSTEATEATEVTEVTVVSRLGMKFSLGPAEVTAVAGAAASASSKLAQLMSSSGSARHHTSYIYWRTSHMNLFFKCNIRPVVSRIDHMT